MTDYFAINPPHIPPEAIHRGFPVVRLAYAKLVRLRATRGNERAVNQIGLYTSREAHYDTGLTANWETGSVYALLSNDGYDRLVGTVSVSDNELRWVWLHPFLRGRGVMHDALTVIAPHHPGWTAQWPATTAGLKTVASLDPAHQPAGVGEAWRNFLDAEKVMAGGDWPEATS